MKYSKEFKIGISVIVAILILVFGIDYLKGINLFRPANFYYAEYPDVAGLEISAPVKANGYKVGQVREIEYDYKHPGKIKVLLALNKQLHVPEDSEAELGETLLSGAFVNLKLGKSSNMLPLGASIKTSESKGLMDAIADEVMPQVNRILPHIDSLLLSLNKVVENPSLAASLNRLDGITGNVLQITDGLNTTVSRDVPRVVRDVNGITTKIDSVSANLMDLSSTLKQLPLSTTVDNVNDITARLSEFSRQLNDPNSTLGLLTRDPELYNRVNRVAADVDSLIVDIKKNPKRYISIKLL